LRLCGTALLPIARLLFTRYFNRQGETKMKRFKKHLILVAVFVGLAIAGKMMNPHPASAVSSNPSLVQIVPSVPFGETESGGFGLPTAIKVPAGQRLIIETLSLQMDVTPSGSQLEAFVNYTSAGKSVTLFVPLTFAYTQTSNGFDTYTATQAVRLYADPGTSISLTAFSPTGSTGTLFLTVSGYLI
jgi:hypothetical protein